MSGQDDVFRRLQARALARFGGISRALDMTKLPAEPMVRGLTAAQWRAVTTRGSGMRPAVRKVFDANWKRNEPSMRYLAGMGKGRDDE